MDKTCTECGEEKPLSGFHKRADSRDGLQSSCKTCRSSYKKTEKAKTTQRKWRKTPQSKKVNRKSHLKMKYSMTPENYKALFEQQGGVCAICGLPETIKLSTGKVKLLAIDHNHLTGKVRGLLCDKCNKGIGGLCVDIKGIKLLISAIMYLLKGQ